MTMTARRIWIAASKPYDFEAITPAISLERYIENPEVLDENLSAFSASRDVGIKYYGLLHSSSRRIGETCTRHPNYSAYAHVCWPIAHRQMSPTAYGMACLLTT